MRAHEGVSFSNISATTAAFSLLGGKYGVTIKGTIAAGSIALQIQMGDGTFADVSAATKISATGTTYAAEDLPAGSYQFALTGASATYITMSRIPND